MKPGKHTGWRRLSAVAAAAMLAAVLAAASPAAAVDSDLATGLTPTAGNQQVTLTFTEPAYAPGQVNTTGYTRGNYFIYVYQDGTQIGDADCANVAGSSESCTISTYRNKVGGGTSTLSNGTAYTFTVVARWILESNATEVNSGESVPSISVTPFTIPSTPAAPTAVVDDTTATTFKVSWVAPASNGSAIDLYTVEVWDKAGENKLAVTGCTSSTTTCNVTNLTNGSAYTFKVKARNAAGDSALSSVSNVATIVPNVPTNVAASVVLTGSDYTLKVTWDTPSPNVENISEYTITATPASGTPVSKTWDSGTKEKSFTLGAPSASLETNFGTVYSVTVKAKNAGGYGSTASANITPSRAPDAPTGVGASVPDTTATITWTSPFTGGEAITEYTAQAFAGDATNTNTPLSGKSCTSSSATTCQITGLTAGTSYKFAVKAKNDTNGYGPWSDLTAASTVPTPVTTTTTTTPPATTTTTTTPPATTTTVASTTTAAPVAPTENPVSPTTTVPVPTGTTTTAPPPTTVPAPAVIGTPVTISRPPSTAVANDAEVGVSKNKVMVLLEVPKAAKSTAQVTKYIITLKPTKGPSITKTISVTAGKTVTPVLTGKAGVTYSLTVTAVTKSGSKKSWTGPKVKTSK